MRVRAEAVQAGLIGVAARLGVSRETLRGTGLPDAVLVKEGRTTG